MGAFAKKEHQFLAELGLAQRNPGAFACGAWGGSGPAVTSTSPTNNQVRRSPPGPICSVSRLRLFRACLFFLVDFD
jgi:hypothetical protein